MVGDGEGTLLTGQWEGYSISYDTHGMQSIDRVVSHRYRINFLISW